MIYIYNIKLDSMKIFLILWVASLALLLPQTLSIKVSHSQIKPYELKDFLSFAKFYT